MTVGIRLSWLLFLLQITVSDIVFLVAVSLTNDCVRYGLGCCFSYKLLSNVVLVVAVSLTNDCVRFGLLGAVSLTNDCQIWSSWLLFLLQFTVSDMVIMVAVSLTNDCVRYGLLGCCFSNK